MNLLLHGVGPRTDELASLRRTLIDQGVSPEQADAEIDTRLPVRTDDALRELGTARYDVVLTNPPFGKKSSVMVVSDEGETAREAIVYEREDFWASTTNKQLNFVQHVRSLLNIHGRAAVVVPDNVLFEGGAGETVRRQLLRECDVHTLLRLPTGIFYAQGVKANVLFFDRKPASPDPWTRKLWVYDLRTNKHFTLKTRRMKRSDLDEFVSCFAAEDRGGRAATWSEEAPEGRWRAFDYDELVARDKCSLDLFWLKDDSLLDAESLPDPDVIAEEIAEDLRSALEQIEGILGDLPSPPTLAESRAVAVVPDVEPAHLADRERDPETVGPPPRSRPVRSDDMFDAVLDHLRAHPGRGIARAEFLDQIEGLTGANWQTVAKWLAAHLEVEKTGARRGTRYWWTGDGV